MKFLLPEHACCTLLRKYIEWNCISVFYYSIALSEWGKVHQSALVHSTLYRSDLNVQRVFSNVTEVAGLVCVFPGKKKSNASDSALMAAPESEGAVGSSAPTQTAIQACGSWG